MTQMSENWRLLIVSRDGHEILLESGLGSRLPRITMPAGQRIAAGIASEVETQLGLRVVALYEIFPRDHADPCGDYYHAAVSLAASENAPYGMHWTPFRMGNAESSFQGEDALAAEALASKLQATMNGCPGEPFSSLDWFDRVTDWISASLRARSMSLTGGFRQFNASSTFSLIQFETNHRPVWFKAVGHPNLREFSIALSLAGICPSHVPKILAYKRDWNAWLAEEAPGTPLSAHQESRHWVNAAACLAEFQIVTIPAVEAIFGAGARDLRFRPLRLLVDPFFEFLKKASLQGSDDRPTVPLSDLRDAVYTNLQKLEAMALPTSLGHMDLNPQNIFCCEHDCVFLDWAEGFVGCPFFAYEYLLQHFKRRVSPEPRSEAEFHDSYFEPWRKLVSQSDLPPAADQSRLAALFAYAATLWSSQDKSKPSLALHDYLSKLARKMARLSLEPQGARP